MLGDDDNITGHNRTTENPSVMAVTPSTQDVTRSTDVASSSPTIIELPVVYADSVPEDSRAVTAVDIMELLRSIQNNEA